MKPKDFHPAYKIKTPDCNITTRKGKYFHLTESKNVDSILSKGLKASDDLIWFFENLDRSTVLTVCMVKNFDWNDFSIIEVDKRGVTGFIVVEKFQNSNHKHIYVKQPLIKPKYLKLNGNYSISINSINQVKQTQSINV